MTMAAKRRENPYTTKQAITLRVPVYLLDLAEELRLRLGARTCAVVLRTALVEGLRALEQAHPAKRRRG
jgi:hypothetical protein